MQRFYRSAYSMFFLLLTGGVMQAQEGNENNTVNITTTAVPFLRISPDARSGGIGDAGIAISPDANSVFYNLSKIPFAQQKAAIGATYTPWLKEIADGVYLATLAGYYQLNDEQAIAASLRYFNAGDLAIVDYNGNKLQTTHPREFAVDFGYARKLSDKFGIAAALRVIHSNLVTGMVNGIQYKAGNAVAGDLSFYYNGLNNDRTGWSAGLSITNLGNKIGYTEDAAEKDFLPANLGIGTAYADAWDPDNRFSIAFDINKLLVPEMPATAEGMKDYRGKGVMESWTSSFGNNAWQFGVGMEYSYREQLYLRAGYNSKTYQAGNWQNITVGAGVHFNAATINFSYMVPTGQKTNRNPLSNTVRFGVLFGWGE